MNPLDPVMATFMTFYRKKTPRRHISPPATLPAETLPETNVRWLMRHIPSRSPFSRERN